MRRFPGSCSYRAESVIAERDESVSRSGRTLLVLNRKNRWVPGPRRHQFFNCCKRLNPSPGPDCHAIQRRGSTGEIELLFQRPVLEKPIDKSGVEDISSSRCIHHWNVIRRDVMKLLAIPRQHAFLPQCRRGENASVTAMHSSQRLLQVFFCHEPAWKISTHNQIVDVLEKLLHTRIKLIQIANHGNARSASPSRRHGRRSGIMTIDVQSPRIHDPFAVEVGRQKNKPLIPSTENRSLARAVDKYQGLRADASRNYRELRLHPCTRKLFMMQLRSLVVAQLSHISCTHSPLLTRNHGRCHLASRQNIRQTVLNLRTTRRVIGEGDQCVNRIQPDADKVHLRQFRHILTVNGVAVNRRHAGSGCTAGSRTRARTFRHGKLASMSDQP
jgi:hypothetical protein